MSTTLTAPAEEAPPQCPKAGGGVHRFLITAANWCRRQKQTKADAETFLENATRDCGRTVTPREIADAVAKAYGLQRYKPTAGWTAVDRAWPKSNLEQIEAIVSRGGGLADLWECSPIRFDDDAPHTSQILEALFPGPESLLCFGAYANGRNGETEHATRPRGLWTRPDAWELIVPNPMTAVWGKTQVGKLSQHTLEATGPRRFLVIECDFSIYARDGKTETEYAPLIRRLEKERINVADMCAAVLLHLAERAPLALAVHSAGKSVHGWFYCAGQPEDVVKAFMCRAVTIGADTATWTRSQFVRMPDGLRGRKQRQAVYFFNPEVIR